MTTINWSPSPRELREWALIVGAALGLAGVLFWFVDWGLFAGGRGFAKFLWSFGVFAFLTGVTGTKLGLPAYWLWMAFVTCVSWVITHVSLALVYFLVVTPLGLLARLMGRDKLELRARNKDTYWHSLRDLPARNPERQF